MPETPPGAAWRQRHALAVAAARAGGFAALAHFRSDSLAVESKADDSPVTRADRESESCIKRMVRDAFPGDAWIGEETGEEGGGSGFRWIVDPIDGTRNFVRGIPLWATLVACEEDGPQGPRVVVAAVAIPGLGELYEAVRGGGARCDGRPLAVSRIDRLDAALFCYESPTWFTRNGLGGVYDRLCGATALQRGLSDAYGHMLVASGRAEVMVEPQLSIWDMAATSLVVEEAGGRFTALDGTPGIRGRGAVVSNSRVHEQTLALVRGA